MQHQESNNNEPEYNGKETIGLYLLLNNSQKEFVKIKFEQLLQNCSVRARNLFSAMPVEVFVVEYLYLPDDKLLNIRGLGDRSLRDVIKLKYQLRAEIKGLLSIPNYDDFLLTNEIMQYQQSINNTPEYQKAINTYLSLNNLQKEFVKTKYEQLIRNFSTRSQNLFSAISIEVFVIEYLYYPDSKLLKIRNLGKNSLEEGVTLKSMLKEEIERLLSMSIETLEKEFLFYRYEKLSDNDFSLSFYEKKQHLPMFWILEQYLKDNNSREIDILIQSFPIYHQQHILSLQEIAQKHNLSNERVRQIRNDIFHRTFEITDDINKEKDCLLGLTSILNNKNDWSYLAKLIDGKIIINCETAEIKDNIEEECCNFSIKFILQIIAYLYQDMYSLKGGFNTSNKNTNDTFLVKKELCEIFNFEKFIDDFKNYIADNDTEHNLNIESYLANSNCWHTTIDDTIFNDILCIINIILLREFNLYPNQDGQIIIPQKKEKDPSTVLYEILKKNNKLMSINDIFVEFKKILPNHKYTNPNQIRSYLQKHEAITYQSRKSEYLLKEWEHIKAGTIRGAIVEFLESKDTPQSVEDITDYIIQFFPSTQKKSIHSTMFSGEKFIQYKKGLFGLSEKQYSCEYEPINLLENQTKLFEQRLHDFEKFVILNMRFPFSSSENKDEPSLYRWWQIQIKNRNKNLSDSQKSEIERIKNTYTDLEGNKSSCEWDLNYIKFKDFLLEKLRIPKAIESENFLYNWWCRAKYNYKKNKLNEKQREKFIEIKAILSQINNINTPSLFNE